MQALCGPLSSFALLLAPTTGPPDRPEVTVACVVDGTLKPKNELTNRPDGRNEGPLTSLPRD